MSDRFSMLRAPVLRTPVLRGPVLRTPVLRAPVLPASVSKQLRLALLACLAPGWVASAWVVSGCAGSSEQTPMGPAEGEALEDDTGDSASQGSSSDQSTDAQVQIGEDPDPPGSNVEMGVEAADGEGGSAAGSADDDASNAAEGGGGEGDEAGPAGAAADDPGEPGAAPSEPNATGEQAGDESAGAEQSGADDEGEPPLGSSAFPAHQLTTNSGGACALAADGELSCWVLEDDVEWATPSGQFAAVVSWEEMFCALPVDAPPVCFPAPGFELDVPAHVPDFPVASLALTRVGACGVDLDGRSFCRDADTFRPADQMTRETPLQHPEDVIFLEVAAGNLFACGLGSDGDVTCWGSEGAEGVDEGQELECAPSTPVGQLRPPAGTYIDVASSNFTSCAITDAGELRCWGAGTDVEASRSLCGREIHLAQGVPPDGGGYRQLDVARAAACALSDSGEVTCWGEGLERCYADGECFIEEAPPGPFRQVSVGDSHACAMRADRTIACWGMLFELLSVVELDANE